MTWIKKGGGGGGGVKGDPFTYEDFTPQQLEDLRGLQGLPGDDGYTPIKGVDYSDGVKGADGKTWHITAAVPSNALGAIGDMHLNTATFDIREKTATSVWTLRGNIKGTAGTNGTNGKTWLTGTVAPTSGAGTVGDFYLNVSTWDIHEKTTATVWTLRGNIKGEGGGTGGGASYTHPETHPASMITTDATKRFTSDTEINGKASLASPTFTGAPKAPTATAGTNTTQLATTAFVKAADDAHKTDAAPHQYGGKFEWKYNATTNSLDLVVL